MSWLRYIWNSKYNPFTIDATINHMINNMKDVESKVDEVQRMIARDIAELEYLNTQKELVLQQIIDCLPDMVWFKDTDGKYVYANKAIKEGLLLCPNPIGHTDVEIAERARKLVGAENHTFGEKCANSDVITLQNQCASRFLESGKVNGKMLYLEVHKNIVRNQDGDIIGVCGSGRDLTEYINAVKVVEALGAKREGEKELIATFKKYEFEEE